MILYGLAGYPVSHSKSPEWFAEKFKTEDLHDRSYRLFPLKKYDKYLPLIRKHQNLMGLNITAPYKTRFFRYMDEFDPVAQETGAINTVKIWRSGRRTKMKGFNTDAEAFYKSADFSGFTHALILGTGGAARSVSYFLKNSKVKCLFVSRVPATKEPIAGEMIRYAEVTEEIIREHTLIINATPLGMVPKIKNFPPIPYEFITNHHFLYDLIYNPEDTIFQKKGREMGARTQNGLKMLHLQAEASFRIWENL